MLNERRYKTYPFIDTMDNQQLLQVKLINQFKLRYSSDHAGTGAGHGITNYDYHI